MACFHSACRTTSFKIIREVQFQQTAHKVHIELGKRAIEYAALESATKLPESSKDSLTGSDQ